MFIVSTVVRSGAPEEGFWRGGGGREGSSSRFPARLTEVEYCLCMFLVSTIVPSWALEGGYRGGVLRRWRWGRQMMTRVTKVIDDLGRDCFGLRFTGMVGCEFRGLS